MSMESGVCSALIGPCLFLVCFVRGNSQATSREFMFIAMHIEFAANIGERGRCESMWDVQHGLWGAAPLFSVISSALFASCV